MYTINTHQYVALCKVISVCTNILVFNFLGAFNVYYVNRQVTKRTFKHALQLANLYFCKKCLLSSLLWTLWLGTMWLGTLYLYLVLYVTEHVICMWVLLLLSLWVLCRFISVLKSALTRSLHRMPQKTQSMPCLRQCTKVQCTVQSYFPVLFLCFHIPVAWIRIRIRRIRMFLDLPDPDPSLFVRFRILPSTGKKSKENLNFY